MPEGYPVEGDPDGFGYPARHCTRAQLKTQIAFHEAQLENGVVTGGVYVRLGNLKRALQNLD